MDWDKGIGQFSWPNPFMGFADSKGKPWPAYYTLQLLIKELDNFSTVKNINAPSGVSLYQFNFSDGRSPVWVAWVEDKRTRGVNALLKPHEVTLNNVLPSVAIEIPTNGKKPKTVQFNKTQGGIYVALTATPVIFK
jgi:hypothetical protein